MNDGDFDSKEDVPGTGPDAWGWVEEWVKVVFGLVLTGCGICLAGFVCGLGWQLFRVGWRVAAGWNWDF